MRFALLMLAISAAGAETPFPGGGWKYVRLDLDVHVEPHARRIRVEGRAQLRLTIPEAKSLALGVNAGRAGMQFVAASAPGAAVRLNQTVGAAPAIRIASFAFDTAHREGDTIEAAFTVEQIANGDQLISAERFTLASWVSRWYPIPAPRTASGSTDDLLAAPGETVLHLPRRWNGASDGALVSRDEAPGGAVERWRTNVAVPRSLIAGDYAVYTDRTGGLPIRVLTFSPQPDRGPRQAKALAGAVRAMEERFGKYPYAGLAIAEVPEGSVPWYAASTPGFVAALGSAFAEPGGNLPLFAHEAAHAWWGNLVVARGKIGETLAQYSAAVAIEAVEGRASMTTFLRFSREGYSPRQCARGYFEILRAGEDKPLAQLGNSEIDHTLADAKGHWVLHMLRDWVGDGVFFSALRSLLLHYAGRGMDLADLRAAFAAAAPPDSRTREFLAQWMDRPGAPFLEASWEQAGGGLRVTVRQRQPGLPYLLKLPLAIDTDRGPEERTVLLEQAEQSFAIKVAGKVRGVRLDPAHRLLLWTPEYGPRPW